MPRVVRNYQHTDFSKLLKELQTPKSVSASKPVLLSEKAQVSDATFVTPARRRRDQLMGNRTMRYAYSSRVRLLHDRDCPYVRQIPDDEFQMLPALDNSMELCAACRRRALLRVGISLDDTKYLDAYVHLFSRFRATGNDLYTLIITNRAQLHEITPQSVQLRVREDNWLLCEEEQELCLYHNSYSVLENYERQFYPQFHLQQSRRGRDAFRYLAGVICEYSWPEHVARLIMQEQQARREKYRALLAGVQNAVREKRCSLLYCYVVVLDCDVQAERLCRQQRVSLMVYGKKSVQGAYELLMCRIPWWHRRRFDAAMEYLKEYSLAQELYDYEAQCRTYLKQPEQKGAQKEKRIP